MSRKQGLPRWEALCDHQGVNPSSVSAAALLAVWDSDHKSRHAVRPGRPQPQTRRKPIQTDLDCNHLHKSPAPLRSQQATPLTSSRRSRRAARTAPPGCRELASSCLLTGASSLHRDTDFFLTTALQADAAFRRPFLRKTPGEERCGGSRLRGHRAPLRRGEEQPPSRSPLRRPLRPPHPLRRFRRDPPPSLQKPPLKGLRLSSERLCPPGQSEALTSPTL